MTTLPIHSIRLDGDTQTRAELDPGTAAEYAEAMKSGATFPPVTVFHDGAEYWLADGFHRMEAASLAELETVEAEILPGSQRDARLYAVSANQAHGLRRSNADKRRAVLALLDDHTWGGWSDREIARQTGTSHPFVASVRSEVEELPPKGHLAIGSAMADGIEWTAFVVPNSECPEAFYVALYRPSDGRAIVTKRPVFGRWVRLHLKDEELPPGLVWQWSHYPVSNESDDDFLPLDRRWSWPHLLYSTKAEWIEKRWKVCA